MNEAVNRSASVAPAAPEQLIDKEPSTPPKDYLSGMFAYQISLLVQYYGKEATRLLERVMAKNIEQM